ncbi:Sodium:neurotransmitter symporter family [Popillia japonica]|uniref:Sodium:neurotransmitter symporter family n=1 Tax=Popillia japonica TaxID=7064 RepID=A0AAW1LS51_POPJA
MSSNEDQLDSDLIDFDIGSPDIPTSPLSTTIQLEDSDNLLDSELPVLEQKLQTAKDIKVTRCANVTVDVEDILISLDDEVTPTSAFIGHLPLQRSNSEILLDLCPRMDEDKLCRSVSCDNLEALVVLKELDAVLNASLTEHYGDDVVDGPVLNDNYLEEFDVSDDCIKDSDGEGVQNDKDVVPGCMKTEINNEEHSLEARSIHAPSTSGGFTAAADTSFAITARKPPRRSKSANFPSAGNRPRIGHALLKNHPAKHSTIAVVKQRTRSDIPLQSFTEETPGNASYSYTPGANIDRISLQNVAGNVPQTQTIVSLAAHATNDGVHPLSPDMDSKEDSRSSWLRSSMRRLRHFRLPSTQNNEIPEVSASINTENVEEPEQIAAPSSVSVQNSVRPVSAPSRLPDCSDTREPSVEFRNVVSSVPSGRPRSNSASSRTRRHTSLSSSESSLASSADTSPTCTPSPTVVRSNQEQVPANNNNNNNRVQCERNRNNEIPDAESPLGQWPHSLSSMLACLSCSLGLFNICRFGILSIHFGANFIFQFFFLSLFVGLPLFTLQLCLGQQLGAGVVDMWRISPLFQGVGVSLLVSQALIGLYSITGVSWMFVYFRDSFITKMDKYRWAEAFHPYRKVPDQFVNISHKLSDTLPDYLSGVVYQRTNLVYGNVYGTIKFQPAFNLAVVWMIVFVSLSKGLRSYGKVIYVFILLPVFGTFILCAKLLGMMPPEYVNVIFPETSWSEFFTNPKSWIAACQEVFLTWGVLSAAVMQIASHNKNKHLLQRDSSLIAVITFAVLILVAFLANTCVQILHSHGYTYRPNSFEKLSTYTFMRSIKDPLPPNLATTPVRYMVHNSYILGEKVVRPGMDHTSESGYQVLRLATELVPATFALLGSERISPFWAVLFYFILILFGIAQQLAIWHCVITGIMAIKAKVLKSWETTITFFSCACGFILGLPMTTELGIYVVYFLDVTVGGLWWLILVILLQIVAVFMVRGRPYSGDTVVTAMFKATTQSCLLNWAPALLSFTWNVVLPVVLMVFCVTFFKNGNFRELFIWHHAPSLDYWPLWARQIGSMIQLLPVLCIPLVAVIQSYRYLNNGPSDILEVAVIQSYRYLNNGPSDILERIQLLYRPPLGEHMDDLGVQEAATTTTTNNTSPTATNIPPEDPPPKYTPPPSYTTATGARIAKLLRQSIRRSVRRIANALGESSSSRQRANAQQNSEVLPPPPPPDYNAVLVEMNQSTTSSQNASDSVDHVVISVTNSSNAANNQGGGGDTTYSGGFTAAHVANILRNSFRSTARAANTLRRSINDNHGSLSAENLVESAAPIGETSLVLEHLSNSDDLNENKPANTEFLSVI